MSVRVLYFAWVRERVGLDAEEIDLPEGVVTVAQFADHLAGRSEDHAAALEHRDVIRFSIDEELAGPDDAVRGAREIAIFPPMTGG